MCLAGVGSSPTPSTLRDGLNGRTPRLLIWQVWVRVPLSQLPGPPNLVIGNHSLATPKIRNTEWQDFYAWLKEVPSLGAPYPARGTYIQTEAMNRIGDVQDVMRYARSLGVRYVELPKGYTAWDKSWFGDWLPES